MAYDHLNVIWNYDVDTKWKQDTFEFVVSTVSAKNQNCPQTLVQEKHSIKTSYVGRGIIRMYHKVIVLNLIVCFKGREAG